MERKYAWGYATADAVAFEFVNGLMGPRHIDVTAVSVDGAPGLELVIEVRDGVPECRRLTIESATEGRGVAHTDVSAVQLGYFVREVWADFASVVDGPGHAYFPGDPIRKSAAVDRARRRKLGPDHLHEVAAVYQSNPASPTAAVAAHFGKSHSAAAQYVRKARGAGLLPETTKGRKTKGSAPE